MPGPGTNPPADESEWVGWHRGYESSAHLTGRLPVVRHLLGEALDRAPPGPIRLASLCAGDGRDVLGVLPGHPRGPDVRARLVELDPVLARRARSEVERLGLSGVEVVEGDASTSSALMGQAPVGVLLLCGIFGNLTDADVERCVRALPRLVGPAATVLWTRARFAPDLTPSIRRWFAETGFDELAFVPIPGTSASVGAHRFAGRSEPFRPDERLFTFLPPAERPYAKSAPDESDAPPR